MSQVRKLILQQIRQEIPEGKALEVQEPEEVLEEVLEVPEEVLEAAVLLEEEALRLETLEEEALQAQAEEIQADEELEVQELAEVLND